MAKLLMNYGAKIDCVNIQGISVLDVLVDRVIDGNRGLDSYISTFIEYIIQHGVQLNIPRNRSFRTERIYNLPAESLMLHGYRPDLIRMRETTVKLESPLLKAVRAGQEDLVQLLLDHGADVNYVGPGDEDALNVGLSHYSKEINFIAGISMMHFP